MKTPDELLPRLREMVDGFLDCDLMKSSAVETGLRNGIRTVIAEIQRDAREGMVAVEDLKPLIRAWNSPNWTLENSQHIWDCIKQLRAKHPDLFTK